MSEPQRVIHFDKVLECASRIVAGSMAPNSMLSLTPWEVGQALTQAIQGITDTLGTQSIQIVFEERLNE